MQRLVGSGSGSRASAMELGRIGKAAVVGEQDFRCNGLGLVVKG